MYARREISSLCYVIFNYYFNTYCVPNGIEKRMHETAACTTVSIVLLSSFWSFSTYKTKEFNH